CIHPVRATPVPLASGRACACEVAPSLPTDTHFCCTQSSRSVRLRGTCPDTISLQPALILCATNGLGFSRNTLRSGPAILLAACTTAVWVVIVCGGEAVQPGLRPEGPRPDTESEIKEVEADIDRIEAAALKSASSGSLDSYQRTIALGKVLLFDKQLSVNRNEAC